MPRHLPLGAGGEFDRLRAIFTRLGDAAAELGDDCALVSLDDVTLAVSIDCSYEGVHFRTDWLSFEEIGWRAGAAALSDLAAEGAKPVGVLVSLGLPKTDNREPKTDPGSDIMAGVAAVTKSVGGWVLSGDLIRADRYLVDVCVLGTAPHPVRRAGAPAAPSARGSGLAPAPDEPRREESEQTENDPRHDADAGTNDRHHRPRRTGMAADSVISAAVVTRRGPADPMPSEALPRARGALGPHAHVVQWAHG